MRLIFSIGLITAWVMNVHAFAPSSGQQLGSVAHLKAAAVQFELPCLANENGTGDFVPDDYCAATLAVNAEPNVPTLTGLRSVSRSDPFLLLFAGNFVRAP